MNVNEMRNETYENNNSNVGDVAVSVSEVGGYEHREWDWSK